MRSRAYSNTDISTSAPLVDRALQRTVQGLRSGVSCLLLIGTMIADRAYQQTINRTALAPGMPTIVSVSFRRGAETRISPPPLLSVLRKTGRYTDQAGSK
jgi:hypothetical protein